MKNTNNKITSLFFISLATSLFTLDMGIVSIALIDIESSFSITNSVTSWVITVFSISSGIGIISLGFLCKYFSRRNVYVYGVLGFTISSSLCGIAPKIEYLLLFRGFQGFFGAGLVALSQALVIDIFSDRNRSKAISAWTFGLLAGPVIGPLLGGYLIEHSNWRWIFFVNLPFGLIAFFGLIYNLEKENYKKNSKINFLAFISLSLAAASMQIIFDRGELEDWFGSSLIITLSLISVLSLIFFIINSYASSKPLFPKKLFKDRYYIGGIIFAFLFGFILIPPFILIPIFLTKIQNFPINIVGLILSCSAIGGMLITFFVSKIIEIIGNVKTMLLGLIIYMLANYEVTLWTSEISTTHIVLNSILRGISISVFYVPLATITYTTLPNKLRTDAASLFQFFRTIGTGLSVAIFITLLNRNYNINFENLRNFFNLSNHGIKYYFNSNDIFTEEKLQLIKIVELNSNINSLMNDFMILAICPMFFFPFFLFFKTK